MHYSGLETIKIVRERQSETLLAFSTGKMLSPRGWQFVIILMRCIRTICILSPV